MKKNPFRRGMAGLLAAGTLVAAMPVLHFSAASQTMVGDANLDGAVTAADIVELQSYLFGKASFDETKFANCDLVADGKVNAFDLAMLKKKNIVEWGSSVIDNMTAAYAEMEKNKGDKPTVLIAPSWQKDNILDSCIENILDELKGQDYNLIVRPHPQYVRHFDGRIDALIEKYKADGIVVQDDFSSNSTVYTADLLVTDWSSIAYEYAFSTLKPVLFINTPMKVVNPDYKELDSVPIDIELRYKVGISLEEDQMNKVKDAVNELLNNNRFAPDAMEKLRDDYIYNVGQSGKAGAKYIIDQLVSLTKKK